MVDVRVEAIRNIVGTQQQCVLGEGGGVPARSALGWELPAKSTPGWELSTRSAPGAHQDGSFLSGTCQDNQDLQKASRRFPGSQYPARRPLGSQHPNNLLMQQPNKIRNICHGIDSSYCLRLFCHCLQLVNNKRIYITLKARLQAYTRAK